MERMLINATHSEETRVALVKNEKLFDLDIEYPAEVKKKSNIYKCRITRIEPSLEAVFVEYGAKRQGFLPFKEVAKEYYAKEPPAEGAVNIRELLREGQELMVQVDKEERGNKGAALTTYITLAGCYLMLMPNNPDSGGISRRIEGDEREEMRDVLQSLNLPEGMGVIIRTAGVGQPIEDLKWDLEILLNQWKTIKVAYDRQPAPFLIYQEGDVIIRSIRDNLRRSIDEIIIDNPIAYAKAKNFLELLMPSLLSRLKLYNDSVPLFSRYQIESQIEAANDRTVLLPSGGVLVIDKTEALVAIDINSAKSTSGADIETTAFHTNLEASEEIARQLRLRDLGGLIVIDFIDMTSTRNQREVENRLKEALTPDRAKIQVGRISRFGLLEMSRQRLRLSLNESIQEVCPQCAGKGAIRRPQARALSLIRLIEEEAAHETGVELHIQLPVEIATFLLNEKRAVISQIEKHHQVSLLVLPNPHLKSVQYRIDRVKKDDRVTKSSFEYITPPELMVIQNHQPDLLPEQPAVQSIANFARESRDAAAKESLFKRLWNKLLGDEEVQAKPHAVKEVASEENHRPRRRPSHNNNRGRQNNNAHGNANNTNPNANPNASHPNGAPRGRRRPNHANQNQANQQGNQGNQAQSPSQAPVNHREEGGAVPNPHPTNTNPNANQNGQPRRANNRSRTINGSVARTPRAPREEKREEKV